MAVHTAARGDSFIWRVKVPRDTRNPCWRVCSCRTVGVGFAWQKDAAADREIYQTEFLRRTQWCVDTPQAVARTLHPAIIECHIFYMIIQ